MHILGGLVCVKMTGELLDLEEVHIVVRKLSQFAVAEQVGIDSSSNSSSSGICLDRSVGGIAS